MWNMLGKKWLWHERCDAWSQDNSLLTCFSHQIRPFGNAWRVELVRKRGLLSFLYKVLRSTPQKRDLYHSFRRMKTWRSSSSHRIGIVDGPAAESIYPILYYTILYYTRSFWINIWLATSRPQLCPACRISPLDQRPFRVAQGPSWDVASLPSDGDGMAWLPARRTRMFGSGLVPCSAISRDPRFDASSGQRPFDESAPRRYATKKALVGLGAAGEMPNGLPASQRKNCNRTPRVCDVLERRGGAHWDQLRSGVHVGSHHDGWWNLRSCKSQHHQHDASRQEGRRG